MKEQGNMEALRVATPYIRAYKGRVFVVKLGGTQCEPGRALDNIVQQLALLYQLGMKLIVVHGGGDQASEMCERLGIKPRIVAGRRITDEATLEVVKMVFAGTVNTNLIAAFRKAMIPAVGLRGVDAELLEARRRPPQKVVDPAEGTTMEVDFGHVGDIVNVRADILQHLLKGDFVPVVCSLAADPSGSILNVNADTVAAQIAVATSAAKYFLVTDVDGVMSDPNDRSTLQSYLDCSQLEELVQSGVVRGGMLPKLAACSHALNNGVPQVHIVNGTSPDTLLIEVFTNEGCGTLLVAKRESAK